MPPPPHRNDWKIFVAVSIWPKYCRLCSNPLCRRCVSVAGATAGLVSSLGKQHLMLPDVCWEKVNTLVVQRCTNTDQTCRWTLVNVKDRRSAAFTASVTVACDDGLWTLTQRTQSPFTEKAPPFLDHKEYYFSASQFSLLASNWLHKSQLLRVRNVAVSHSVIFTLIYQFIKIHWCRIGERKWQHKSGPQHNDPNQLGIAENVTMNYVLVLVPLYSLCAPLWGGRILPTWRNQNRMLKTKKASCSV